MSKSIASIGTDGITIFRDAFDELRTDQPNLSAVLVRAQRYFENARTAESELAALREKVEAWEWFGECFDNCKQRGKLPLEVHKTPSAYSEAWASLWAAREAVQ